MKSAVGNLIIGAAPLLACLSIALMTATGQPGNADAKRGEYLVRGGGCGDCHTPKKMEASGPEPDMSRILSGHP
jgi:mono/diheme cytochrome c family protein